MATVSRVINAPEKVLKETRDRVNAAVEELRFVPSAAARAINSGRSRIVAALVPTLDHSIFTKFIENIENELARRGLSLIVATTNYDADREAEKARELIDIGAEGFVVSGITHSQEFDRLIDRVGVPTVATSYYASDYRLPTVGYDNTYIPSLALEHLYELGHRRIAVVHGERHNNDRTRARLESLENTDLPVELEFLGTGLSVDAGCAAVRNALSVGERHSAYLCLSDALAIGVIYELQRNGIEVPREVSVTGMEDLPNAALLHPPLTTVRVSVPEMGTKAAELLAYWLETGEKPDRYLLPAELIVRQSTARCE